MNDKQVPPELMRAGDVDRDAVAERLGYAFQEGRLNLEEYQERLDLTMRAKVMADLASLTRDLPAPPERTFTSAPAEQADAHPTWRERLEPWRGLAAVSMILVGIWGITSVITGMLLPFWPLVPIGFMFMFTLANAISGTYLDGSGHQDGDDQ